MFADLFLFLNEPIGHDYILSHQQDRRLLHALECSGQNVLQFGQIVRLEFFQRAGNGSICQVSFDQHPDDHQFL